MALDHFTLNNSILAKATERLTLYASAHDRALFVSQTVHQGPRVGRATPDQLFLDAALDTIDASEIDKPGWLERITKHPAFTLGVGILSGVIAKVKLD